jgi:DNA polymerase-3 subunit gamma/tau
LKALDEVAQAPNAMMAAEMAVIRLTHVADLPPPEDVLRKLQDTPVPTAPAPQPAPTGGTTGPSAQTPSRAPTAPTTSGAATALAVAPEHALARYAHFDQVVDLIRANRDVKLLVEVETALQLARYQPGRIEFQPTQDAPRDLASRLSARLQLWTGVRWAVSVVNEGGGKTIAGVRDEGRLALEAKAREHPLVQAVFAAFPQARITDIRTPDEIEAEAAVEALPEVDEEWDPFEDG